MVWRISAIIPTVLTFKPQQGQPFPGEPHQQFGQFNETIQLSLNGLMRTYTRRYKVISPLGERPPGFEYWISLAIQQAWELAIGKTLTYSNYEMLDVSEDNPIRAGLVEGPVVVLWNRINNSSLSLLSFKTSIWNDFLIQRYRKQEDKNFIDKFQ